MQKRRLGKTDIELSVLGLGGVVVMNESQADADRRVAEAIGQVSPTSTSPRSTWTPSSGWARHFSRTAMG